VIDGKVRKKIEDLIARARALDAPAGIARNSREVSVCEGWITEALNVVELAAPQPNNAYRRKVDALAKGSGGLIQAVHSIAKIFGALLADVDAGLIGNAGSSGHFANFRAVYDDLTDEVLRSTHTFLPDHLRNLFSRIDKTPDVAKIVADLQKLVDIDKWLAEHMRGSAAKLSFPEDPTHSLAMRVSLFRAVAENKVNLALLGFHFLRAGRNANDSARAFVDQVFRPMAGELRRYLQDKLSTMSVSPGVDRQPVGPTRIAVTTEPTASTTPTVVELNARASSGSQGSAGLSVNRAGTTSNDTRTTFAQRLSERPEDIGAAARDLSKAIADQIERLHASKPNDADSLAKQNDFVAFLEKIAGGLNDLADALDRAASANTNGTLEPILLGKAAEIAAQLNTTLQAGLERHRDYICDCAIRFGVFGAGFLFLHACGVDGYIAGAVAALMNVSLAKK
jgi:hypothetical protein